MASDLVFDWIEFDEALALGVEDMLYANWEEVAGGQADYPLDPDWPKYFMLERAGIYRSVAARQDGKLIGYSGYFVQPTMHHRASVWAVNDLLYLDARHRRGLTGVHLIEASIGLLRTLGVKRVIHSVTLHSPRRNGHARLGRLLSRLGFAHDEDQFVLDL